MASFHTATRQILGMHVGKRTKRSAEILNDKKPEKEAKFLYLASFFYL